MNETPLTRTNVTASSRVMLPFYVLFNLALGGTWMVQDPERSSAGIRALERMGMPVDVSGGVLVALGILIAVGLLSKNRVLASFTLLVAMLTYLVLATAIILALRLDLSWHHSVWILGWPELAASNPRDSLSAPLWSIAFAVACFASFRSLMADEYTDQNGNQRR